MLTSTLRDPTAEHAQCVWSVEFSQAAPYLLTLGLSKSAVSLVLLAGPLAGLVVQPLVGAYSDNCKSSLGRRRPFIIAGGVLCICALLLFGYAQDVARLFTPEGSSFHNGLALSFAVVAIYIMDFSINAVQAMDRAIIVDIVPVSQQEDSNAWAGRMLGLGAIAGYFISGANLTKAFGWISSSQIKLISLLAAIVFVVTHTLTCSAVTERVLLAKTTTQPSSLKTTVINIWATFRTLPRPIWRVMQVQLCGWVAMFALLFYSSTWVAEMYLQQNAPASDDLSTVDSAIADAATRAGSRALFIQSIVMFGTSVVAPLFVVPTGAAHTRTPPRERFHFVDTDMAQDDLTARVLVKLDAAYERIALYLPTLPFAWLTLPRAWGMVQASFSILMFSTWLVSGVGGATTIIALSGVTMGMAMWAPFALLGELILQQPDAAQPLRTFMPLYHSDAYPPPLSPIPEEDEDDAKSTSTTFKTPEQEHHPFMNGGHAQAATSGSNPDRSSATIIVSDPDGKDIPTVPQILQLRHSDSFDEEDRPSLPGHPVEDDLILQEGTADSAGTILGIHNICIVLPQLFTTFFASVLFSILAPAAAASASEGEVVVAPGSSDAIGTILRLGGIATLFAAWFCHKMDREERRRLHDFAPV